MTKKKVTQSIAIDESVHDWVTITAGSYNQSISSHVNYLLSALEDCPQDLYRQIISQGVEKVNNKKYGIE